MGVLPRVVRGEGSYLYDADGRRYLDGSGGPAAFSIGHGNREVNAAIARQLEQVACGYRYLFTSEPLEELTRLMLARCGPHFGHIVYSGSGSEAVESALKGALQYWGARGRSEEHTSELQSPCNLVCRLLLDKKDIGQAHGRRWLCCSA